MKNLLEMFLGVTETEDPKDLLRSTNTEFAVQRQPNLCLTILNNSLPKASMAEGQA